jgi:undecaprenyl-diphosphatase
VSSIAALDRAVFDWFATLHTPWLDVLMLAASYIGVGGAVWLAIAGVLFVASPARRQGAWRLMLAVGLASLLVDGVLKPAIGRDRPYVGHDTVRVIYMKTGTSSFPSGHAALSMAGAAAAVQVLPAARIAWWALAAIIAVSRVYVGVHFPIDIVAGAILGLLCARLVLKDVKRQDAPFAIGPVQGT